MVWLLCLLRLPGLRCVWNAGVAQNDAPEHEQFWGLWLKGGQARNVALTDFKEDRLYRDEDPLDVCDLRFRIAISINTKLVAAMAESRCDGVCTRLCHTTARRRLQPIALVKLCHTYYCQSESLLMISRLMSRCDICLTFWIISEGMFDKFGRCNVQYACVYDHWFTCIPVPCKYLAVAASKHCFSRENKICYILHIWGW